MKIIANQINNVKFEWIIDNCPTGSRAKNRPSEIKAAIAYATHERFFDIVDKLGVKFTMYGRHDYTVPVVPKVLKRFLGGQNLNWEYVLVEKLHAKVVWFVGYGVYIGSANFTNPAWDNGLEMGCWFSDAEISRLKMKSQLENFFESLEPPVGTPLTTEQYEKYEEWYAKRKNKEQNDKKEFNDHYDLSGGTIKQPTTPRINGITKYERFYNEWTDTLETTRRLSSAALQVFKDTHGAKEAGGLIQVDQFLHAYYFAHLEYEPNKKKLLEQLHRQNKKNPQRAVESWVDEFHEADLNHEDFTNAFAKAPRMAELLSRKKLPSLSEDQFVEVMLGINAFWTSNRHILTKEVKDWIQERGLTALSKEEKAARWLYFQYGDEESTIKRLEYFLYGGPKERTLHRFADIIKSEKHSRKIYHFGEALYGEILGWAMPNDFPIRNERTNRALKALGFDIRLFSPITINE